MMIFVFVFVILIFTTKLQKLKDTINQNHYDVEKTLDRYQYNWDMLAKEMRIVNNSTQSLQNQALYQLQPKKVLIYCIVKIKQKNISEQPVIRFLTKEVEILVNSKLPEFLKDEFDFSKEMKDLQKEYEDYFAGDYFALMVIDYGIILI